jgi:oxygen-independent coproporphyrinogen-3 oxidase
VLNREANGAETHRAAVDNVREAGFGRLNLDLMYGFKDQSLEGWRATVRHAIDLDPEYITLYRMRYRLTRISHQASAVTLERVRPMERLAKAMLLDAGYFATSEKTTWSRVPGDVGTSSYLARRVREGLPYLGLGLGAQSFTDTTIAYNDGAASKSLPPYLRSVEAGRLPIQDLYDLPAVQMMGKMCSVSFHFGEIHRPSFEGKFGVALEEAYPRAVDFVLREGLMEFVEETDALRLTARGCDSKNGVHALFYAPSIQGYLLSRDPEGAEDFERHRRSARRLAAEEPVPA